MARVISKLNRQRAGSAGASTTEYILLLAGCMLLVTTGLSLFQQTLAQKTVEAAYQLELAGVEDGGGTYSIVRCEAIARGIITPRNEEERVACINGARRAVGSGNEQNHSIRNQIP
jgi:hypothetical protein